MQRIRGRAADALRPLKIMRGFQKGPAGSVLIEMGRTRVICAASVENRVPYFLRGTGTGWIKAEYALLPSATATRTPREACQGRQSGRTQEIQRLIGRSLRACVDLTLLGERQILIDCDVIQADGGTRTASITGAFVALQIAIQKLLDNGTLPANPLIGSVAAVSAGMVNGVPLLDLDYSEDSGCDSDVNIVMLNAENIIEIQGTAEGAAFSVAELNALIALAQQGIAQLTAAQQQAFQAAFK